MRLTAAQARFLDSPALYRGFVGGRGAGKSFIGAYDLFKRVRPNRLYMIAAPTYPMLRDTTFRSFRTMARLLQRPYTLNKTDGIVTLANRAEVLLRTTNDPERLRGPNLSGVWFDEASLMLEEAYDIALPSLREGGNQGWLSLTFTPKGKAHWTYKRTAQSADVATDLIHSHTKENPFLPPNFVETISRQYGAGLFAQQELGGQFLDMGDTEWPSAYFERPDFWFTAWPSRTVARVLFYDGAGSPGAKVGDWHAAAMLVITDDGHLWFELRLWRGPQEQAAEVLCEIAEEFRPDVAGVEANFGGEIMVPLIRMMALRRNRADLAGLWQGLYHTLKKESRIRRLGSYFADGHIHLRDTVGGREAMRQIEQFPVGDHDDAPDAMDGCRELAGHLLGVAA